MKNLIRPRFIALVLMLGIAAQSVGQNYNLEVLDPQNRWYADNATIEKASLTIRPQGIYMEYGLYLTISARGSHYYGQANPPLEIVMNFCLPERAIIHDSWLWVNNDIMQAILIDRQLAYQIYEGIVNRRRDPSILSKSSDGCYELRIYPLAGNSTRKVKITYLVPARWTRNHVSSPLPIDILLQSSNVPELELNIHTDSVFNNPVINELGYLPFGTYDGSGVYSATISPSLFNDFTSLEFSYESPMKDGLFSIEYPASSNAGYYQLIFDQQRALGVNHPKKIAIVLEFNDDYSQVEKNELFTRVKEMLLEYFSPTDSFNLFFASSNGTVNQSSSHWMPVTQVMINSAFSSVPAYWYSAGYTEQLLTKATSFIKDNNGNGEVLLISNLNGYMSTSTANQMANQLVTLSKPDISIHVINYADYSGYYNGSSSYDYLFQQLAGFTGGNYVKHQYENQDYYWDDYYNYGNQVTTFSELLHTMFASLDVVEGNYALTVKPDQGFCYSELDISDDYIAGQPKMYAGRYYGNAPLKVEYSGLLDSSLISKSWQIASYIGDSLTRKIWAGNFIFDMETGPQLNSTKREIIDTSLSNRVLSIYTAFLALEPNDTISACENCVDDSDDGTAPTSVSQLDSLFASISASPNPFESSVTISITLKDDVKQAKLKIYDMVGKEVRVFEIDALQRTITVTWDGDDSNGNQVPGGVYIAVLESAQGKQILKIVKAN